MRTRSSSNRIVKSFTISRRRNKCSQQQVVPNIVEIPIVTMADNRTMEKILQAPTKGYGDAIVVPDILAEHFEIRTGLLSLIQANKFHGFESNNPHDHIRSFNRITSTLKFRNALEKQQAHQLELLFGPPEVDVFGTRLYHILCNLGYPFHYRGERRKRSRNRWSIVRNTTSSGDCFQITPWVSNSIAGKLS
nr:reverse transcriptase domain-containing protein [Tanacetum cinerariifolium]